MKKYSGSYSTFEVKHSVGLEINFVGVDVLCLDLVFVCAVTCAYVIVLSVDLVCSFRSETAACRHEGNAVCDITGTRFPLRAAQHIFNIVKGPEKTKDDNTKQVVMSPYHNFLRLS